MRVVWNAGVCVVRPSAPEHQVGAAFITQLKEQSVLLLRNIMRRERSSLAVFFFQPKQTK